MIQDIDQDESNTIDYNEFLKLMTQKMGEKDTKEEISKAFKLFDEDETVRLLHHQRRGSLLTPVCWAFPEPARTCRHGHGSCLRDSASVAIHLHTGRKQSHP